MAFGISTRLPADVESPDSIVLEHDNTASGSTSVLVGSDVLILPSSAHEKFTVLVEERRREGALLTGGPHPPPALGALKPCPLKDRKQLAFDGLKWLPGTFPHASGCSSFGAAFSASLHHFTPEKRVARVWGGGTHCRSWRKLF